VTTFTYDGLNRRTFAGFGTRAGPTYESTIGYSYDAGNRLTQAVDSVTGAITRGYDGLDRLTSEATPQGAVSYTYDNASRRASMTVAGQTAVNYSYDNANRLTGIAQGSSTVSFAYDAGSRRTSLTLPNGIVMSYSYDSASQLSAINYQLGTTTLGNLTYTYDLAGRRANVGGTFARTGLPLPVTTTAYNANNQLSQWGTATLAYDANGNMLSDGTNSYVWNARNQLASMNLGGNAFQYDPFGRRSSRTVSGATTNFLYDGVNPVQELSGTTPIANLLTGGIDEYFARTDSAGARSFLTDALGSTLALADSTGTTKTSYTFDPFGNTSSSGVSSTNSFQYTGRELDGTGLYFYRARYYNPTIQRFISEDPKRFRTGEGNFYGYVFNSPLNFKDPKGLDKQGPLDRTKDVNRCAGQLSQSFSLNPSPGNFLTDAFFGNQFGTIAQAALGPDKGNALGQLALNNPIPKASLNSLVQAGIAAIPTGGLTTSLSVPISYFPGTYNLVTLVQTATTIGDTGLGGAALGGLALLEAGKLVFDAGVYVGALVVCSEQ
jgi:RHS repeat-associated protein